VNTLHKGDDDDDDNNNNNNNNNSLPLHLVAIKANQVTNCLELVDLEKLIVA
jgi:hypothetical protein